jgi:dTDP-4-dehydrorhamnose 3,5-epimerase-like enzyme
LKPEILVSEAFKDQRGSLYAFPTFNLSEIVRIYSIEPAGTNFIRAWQGHRKERKWFLVNSGSFEFQTIPLADTQYPIEEGRKTWYLHSCVQQVLAIPAGYLNGFRALEDESRLLVFSDFDLEASKFDHIRYSLDDIPWISQR